jgi:hypothetical protein
MKIKGGTKMPQEIIFACPSCAHEGRKGDKCPECNVLLVACCAHCGNRIVGEHVQMTGDQQK